MCMLLAIERKKNTAKNRHVAYFQAKIYFVTKNRLNLE